MAAAKITSKGQITLPKVIRDLLHLENGDCVDFVIQDNHQVILRPKTLPLSALRGCLPYSGKSVSLDSMNRAIQSQIRNKYSK